MVSVEGEAGHGWVTSSGSVVYADEGLASHFSISQNHMNACLLAEWLAPGWLQVIACCKHASKLQDSAEPCHWS